MLMALRFGSYLLDEVDGLRHYLDVRVAALRLYPHRVGIVHPLRRNPQLVSTPRLRRSQGHGSCRSVHVRVKLPARLPESAQNFTYEEF